MKEIKEKTKEISNEIMIKINQVLDEYDLGDVHIESFRLAQGAYSDRNCRKVCQLYRNPRTGERKVVCRMICDD